MAIGWLTAKRWSGELFSIAKLETHVLFWSKKSACLFKATLTVKVILRVSDPHCFNADPDTDPDPTFFLIADPDSGSGSRNRIQGLMI